MDKCKICERLPAGITGICNSCLDVEITIERMPHKALAYFDKRIKKLMKEKGE